MKNYCHQPDFNDNAYCKQKINILSDLKMSKQYVKNTSDDTGSGIDLFVKDQANLVTQRVPDHTSKSCGDHTERYWDDRVQSVLNTDLGTCNGKDPQANGIK